MTKQTSSEQFGVQPFAKTFLYFGIITLPPILDFVFLSLISLLESIYLFDFTFHFNCAMTCIIVFINYIK